MDDKVKELECQVCGHKACDHIAKMVEEHVNENVRLHTVLETAAKIAGEKLTKKILPEEHIRRVTDMIIREEGMVTWMTLDERKAMEMDLGYRDQRIQELEERVKILEKGQADAQE